MEVKEIVERDLENNFGWRVVTFKVKAMRQLLWADVISRKNTKIRAIVIKDTDSINEVYWQLFESALLSQKGLEICIAIPTHRIRKYQTKKIEDRLKEVGIGLMEITARGMKELILPRSRIGLKKLKHKKEKSDTVLVFFLSSDQNIVERKIVEKKIKEAGQHHGFYVKVIMREREVDINERDLKKKIREGISKSDMVLAIIGESYRKWVDYELDYAFKQKKPTQIACFVKSASEDRPDDLNRFLKKLQNKTKYAVFTSQNELRDEVANTLRERLRLLKKI